MKRVVCVRIGESLADGVEVVDAEAPIAGAGEVLVKVLVRPINPADELLQAGARAVVSDDDALPDAVRRVVGPAGVRRALDAVAGDGARRLFHCVADRGGSCSSTAC